MIRRRIMVKLSGRQYISCFQFWSWYGRMSDAVCVLSVRQRGVGPESKEEPIGIFRVKSLKPKAFIKASMIPGTFKSWEENKNARK